MKPIAYLLVPGSLVTLVVLTSRAAAPADPPTTRAAPATQPGTTPSAGPATRPLEPWVHKLTVRPSAAPRPALRYRLLPDVTDRTAGDASLLYMIAAKRMPEPTRYGELFPENETVDYLNMPLDRLPVADVERSLAEVAELLQVTDVAARRDEARWDSALREQGIWALLPYLNDMRALANVLAVRTRAQIARRDWAAAERGLQTGFAMARHLNDRAVLIQGLIQIGIAQLVLERVHEWIAGGDSPNLYWALSGLPHPFVDRLTISQWERANLPHTDPLLARAAAGTLPPGEWPRVLEQVVRIDQMMKAAGAATRPAAPPDPAAEAARLAATVHPQAKQFLLAAGLPPAEVEAMPAAQAVGTYFFRQYRDASDELWKGYGLPYLEALDLIRRQEQESARWGPSSASDNPLLRWTHGAWRARHWMAELDQHVAALRTIEALRDYAARHDGRPPERLDQITDLPIPIDPTTGRSFAYRLDGRTAVIDAPMSPGVRIRSTRYEVTFAP